MTTSPVVSITDDLIAELEESANQATHKNWAGRGDEIGYISREDDQSYGMFCPLAIVHSERNVDYISMVTPRLILALLAERADLKQQLAAASVDAERYDWLREMHNDEYGCLWVSRWDYGQVAWVSLDAFCRPGYDGELDLDAAIDAARNIAGSD